MSVTGCKEQWSDVQSTVYVNIVRYRLFREVFRYIFLGNRLQNSREVVQWSFVSCWYMDTRCAGVQSSGKVNLVRHRVNKVEGRQIF